MQPSKELMAVVFLKEMRKGETFNDTKRAASIIMYGRK